MKHFLVINALILSFFAFSQEYTFTPKWKIGEKKTLSIITDQKEIKDGEITTDTTFTSVIDLTVLKKEGDVYTLETFHPNVAIATVIPLYPEIVNELPKYQKVKYISTFNKKTGVVEVINSDEISDIMTKSFEEVTKTLKKKAEIEEWLINLTFISLKMTYQSEKSIQDAFEKEMNLLFIPYGETLTLNKKSVKTVEEENPFKPGTTLNQTTTTELVSINSKTNKCQINQKLEFDLEPFLDIMKKLLAGFSEMATTEEKKKDFQKSLDNMVMDMITNSETFYNTKSTWITKSTLSIDVKASIPTQANKQSTITKTMIVK